MDCVRFPIHFVAIFVWVWHLAPRGVLADFFFPRNVHEAWVVYKSDLRFGRRVAFASNNKETVFRSMPIHRTNIGLNPRTDFNASGENSTYETTYTGVESVPWASLPLISRISKERLVGHEVEAPAETQDVMDTSVGMPLFWQERKSCTFWQALFKDVNAKAVFDLTPGSGQCARAAMEMGLNYACLARNAEHSSWLINICDREALRQICQSGSPLHMQDLAGAVKEHFAEVLEQLNQQDAAEDMSPELEEEDQ